MDIYEYLNIKELIQIKEDVVERLGISFSFKDYIMFHINEIMMDFMFKYDNKENNLSFSSIVEKNIYSIYTKLLKEDVKFEFDSVYTLKLMITVRNDFFKELLDAEINILDLVKEERKRKLYSLDAEKPKNIKNIKR